jgi:hypothetical protein
VLTEYWEEERPKRYGRLKFTIFIGKSLIFRLWSSFFAVLLWKSGETDLYVPILLFNSASNGNERYAKSGGRKFWLLDHRGDQGIFIVDGVNTKNGHFTVFLSEKKVFLSGKSCFSANFTPRTWKRADNMRKPPPGVEPETLNFANVAITHYTTEPYRRTSYCMVLKSRV